MLKKYRVRLSDEERAALKAVVRKFKGSNQKVRRAQILLQADESGPGWTDAQIAIAYGCRTRTVEQVRERLVTVGFTQTLEGKRRESPATEKVLNGAQEAQVIALRLGGRRPPAMPTGHCGCWPAKWWNWQSWLRSATKRFAPR